MFFNLWITDSCNMECPYCYTNRNNPNEMKEDMANKIINFIDKNAGKEEQEFIAINFFGGEPLLNFNFIKIMVKKLNENRQRWTKSHISFLITTNGTLLNEENIDFMKRNRFGVSVSLDGIPEVHDKTRLLKGKKPSWNIVEKNIPLLLKNIPDAFARMTVSPDNVGYLYESVDFLIKKGFKNIKPIPDYFDDRWEEKEFGVLNGEINKIIEDYKNKYSKENVEIMFLKEKRTNPNMGLCDGGKTSFSIASNGDIYPCNYAVGTKEFCMGNIENLDSIKEPFHCDKKLNRAECKGCQYYNCCISKRCVYVNYNMTKEFDKPSGFFCAYEKLLFDINNKLSCEGY